MRKLIAVVGPTATGKTALAVALASAIDGEIVGECGGQIVVVYVGGVG